MKFETDEFVSNEFIQAKRCPDYDDECSLVQDHVACFIGGITFDYFGNMYETPMAEGYCPFLVGQEIMPRPNEEKEAR